DDLAYFVERAGAEGDADIVDTLSGMQVEIELGLHAPEPADVDDAAEQRARRHGLIDGLARHHVDGEVHALAVGRLEHLVGPAWVAGIDREIGAELREPSAPLRIGRRAAHEPRA